MSAWMKEWGQFILMLVAIATLYGFIRADFRDVHARIDTLSADVRRNGEAIAELTGLVRGLHKLDLAQEDR